MTTATIDYSNDINIKININSTNISGAADCDRSTKIRRNTCFVVFAVVVVVVVVTVVVGGGGVGVVVVDVVVGACCCHWLLLLPLNIVISNSFDNSSR